jgi:hypothetical protein
LKKKKNNFNIVNFDRILFCFTFPQGSQAAKLGVRFKRKCKKET